MPKPNEKMFGVQHRNAIAKDIREEFDLHATGFTFYEPTDPEAKVYHAKASALCDLAVRFANRFSIDDYEFDAPKWLDQCSPDPDRYPLSELWED